MLGRAARAGVDLQISGHTHGGQLWPLTQVALLEQPVLAGLVRVGSPPEITLLTLRARAVP